MVCDWGCGSMRVLRHLPDFFGVDTFIYWIGLQQENY